MKKYRVGEIAVTIHSGRMRLTAEQAQARAHAVKKDGDGLYEIVQPVQFKAGEVIEIEEEVGKALSAQLVDVSPAPRKSVNQPNDVAGGKTQTSDASQEKKS